MLKILPEDHPQEALKRVDLDQGTDEWLAWRKGRLTASMAAVVMGAAPSYWAVRTIDQLRSIMLGTWEPPPPDAELQALFDRGHRIEAEVRQRFEEESFSLYPAACYERGPFSVSLDGDCPGPGAGSWLEVKSVRNSRSTAWRMAKAGEIPAHYIWQLVHQAGVLEAGWTTCHYIVSHEEEDVRITLDAAILRKKWAAELDPAWRQFLASIEGAPTGGDESRLAADYWRAKEDADRANEILKSAKAALLRSGPRTIPDAMEIRLSEVKGRVDYQRALAEAGVEDLEPWRKDPSRRTTIVDLRGEGR